MKRHFENRLKEPTPILLDGAIGTELERRGVDCSLPLWSTPALEKHPDTLQTIYEEYIEAGAEIITANTFRTNSRTLEKVGLPHQAKKYTDIAIEITKAAKSAANKNHEIWIAGSVAPLEDCYQPNLVPSLKELEQEHAEHIDNLANAGVDVLLIETMNAVIEAKTALKYATQTNIPTCLSFVITKNLELLSGETIDQIIPLLESYEPKAIGINCNELNTTTKAVKYLHTITETPIIAYANLVHEGPHNIWKQEEYLTSSDYTKQAQVWVKNGAKIIGGCCGTTPKIIKSLKEKL